MSPSEILQWRDLYKSEYRNEINAENIAKGISSSKRIGVRFNPI
jgi:hypothetical protein